MSSDIIEIQQRLGAIAAKLAPNAQTADVVGEDRIQNLRQLSGGASQETWSFDVAGEGYILRREPDTDRPRSEHAVSLNAEADIIRAVAPSGAPCPNVVYVCAPEDELGSAFVMTRMQGETIARKILRDDEFKDARPKLARQCGEALAKIHHTPTAGLSELTHRDAVSQLDMYEDTYRAFQPRPVFELAFRTLRSLVPSQVQPVLVHGDFRNGNLMINAEGLEGVLDWELAHLGDPREDFGWLCVNSWRFGETQSPVGGFGTREDLLAGYKEAGGAAFSVEDIRYWEMLGTLKWGVMCLTMYDRFKSGSDRSVERVAIGRRASETEMDLVNIFKEMEAAYA